MINVYIERGRIELENPLMIENKTCHFTRCTSQWCASFPDAYFLITTKESASVVDTNFTQRDHNMHELLCKTKQKIRCWIWFSWEVLTLIGGHNRDTLNCPPWARDQSWIAKLSCQKDFSSRLLSKISRDSPFIKDLLLLPTQINTETRTGIQLGTFSDCKSGPVHPSIRSPFSKEAIDPVLRFEFLRIHQFEPIFAFQRNNILLFCHVTPPP